MNEPTPSGAQSGDFVRSRGGAVDIGTIGHMCPLPTSAPVDMLSALASGGSFGRSCSARLEPQGEASSPRVPVAAAAGTAADWLCIRCQLVNTPGAACSACASPAPPTLGPAPPTRPPLPPPPQLFNGSNPLPPPPPAPAMEDALNAWLTRVVALLRQRGGVCDLSIIGTYCPLPHGTPSRLQAHGTPSRLRATLEGFPQVLRVEQVSGSYTVRFVTGPRTQSFGVARGNTPASPPLDLLIPLLVPTWLDAVVAFVHQRGGVCDLSLIGTNCPRPVAPLVTLRAELEGFPGVLRVEQRSNGCFVHLVQKKAPQERPGFNPQQGQQQPKPAPALPVPCVGVRQVPTAPPMGAPPPRPPPPGYRRSEPPPPPHLPYGLNPPPAAPPPPPRAKPKTRDETGERRERARELKEVAMAFRADLELDADLRQRCRFAKRAQQNKPRHEHTNPVGKETLLSPSNAQLRIQAEKKAPPPSNQSNRTPHPRWGGGMACLCSDPPPPACRDRESFRSAFLEWKAREAAAGRPRRGAGERERQSRRVGRGLGG